MARMGQAACVSPLDSAQRLALRVRAALEQGGLRFDPEAHERRLRTCFASSEEVTGEVLELLERARPLPETDAEYSLLAALDTMVAFSCYVSDEACRLTGAGSSHEVRLIVSVYVVGSAIFDHVCDCEVALVPLLRERLSAARLEAALQDGRGLPIARDGDPGLLAFLDALVAELVARLRALGDREAQDRIARGLIDAYRAQLRSTSRGRERDTGTIWSTPFWLALHVAAAYSPDPQVEVLEAAGSDTRRIGELLSLVDDAVDLADDWASGSANQLLARAGVTGGRDGSAEPPWERLLADDVCGPYLDELSHRARALPPRISRDALAAWLHHWLGGSP